MALVSRSWLELKPNEDLNENQEWFEGYYERIRLKREYKHIPKAVFKQWIHPHHRNHHTVKNYAWLDFENIEFIICEWDLNLLLSINVIESFKDYYFNRSSFSDFDQFCCKDEDLDFWKKKGTWRIPPIVLDLKSVCSAIPEWSELTPPYQLVEGHSRLGYLQSTKRISDLSKGKISDKHYIYLMKESNKNTQI